MNRPPVTAAEVLALTGVTQQAVRRWMRLGQFPKPLNPRSTKRIWNRDHVEAWLAGRYQGVAHASAG